MYIGKKRSKLFSKH